MSPPPNLPRPRASRRPRGWVPAGAFGNVGEGFLAVIAVEAARSWPMERYATVGTCGVLHPQAVFHGSALDDVMRFNRCFFAGLLPDPRADFGALLVRERHLHTVEDFAMPVSSPTLAWGGPQVSAPTAPSPILLGLTLHRRCRRILET